MSLEENAGQQEQRQKPQGDSLLPLEFQNGAGARKPLPLGQFIKKSESGEEPEPPVRKQAPILEPTPSETPSAPAQSESAAPLKAVESPAQPKPLTAVQSGSAAKPIPLTARPKTAEQQPKPLSGARPAPRTFTEKEHDVMKQQASKAQEKPKPLKAAAKPLSSLKQPGAASQGRLQESTLGGMMQAARARAGLSLPQVEEATRIKKSYLEALEADDVGNLPPSVFVSAYIRNLSSLYNISAADLEVVQEKLKEIGAKHEVPEALIQNLEKDGQVNMAEEARVRKMLIGAAIGLLLIVLWVSGIYIGLKFKHSRELANAEAVVESGAAATSAATAASSNEGEEAAPQQKRVVNPPIAASSSAFNSALLEKFVFPENPTMSELRLPVSTTPQAATAQPAKRR